MSLNFAFHVVLGTLFVAFMAKTAWTRMLKAWPPDRQPMRDFVAGLLLVSLGSTWWVMATGPGPWFNFAAALAPYFLAFYLSARIRSRSRREQP